MSNRQPRVEARKLARWTKQFGHLWATMDPSWRPVGIAHEHLSASR